jgi:TatD DNase family protein
MIYETHAHYDDERFNDSRDELLAALPANNIYRVINVGADMQSSRASIALAEKYPYIYAAVGVHPHDVLNMKEDDIDELKRLSKHDKVLAIGEIGLDYHYDAEYMEQQHYWFKRQLELAEEVKLPIIVHSREASQDSFDLIKQSSVRSGVIHAYSGGVEMARDYIDMGFYIGVGGVVTFKNAKKLVEVVKDIPIERILLETDSPYLSPEPVRGTCNNSQNLKYIVPKISEIKQINPEIVIEITRKNAERLFDRKKVVA